VIASLNCVTDHGWIDYARQIEAAGAAALELNIYLVPANVDVPGREIEQRYVNIVSAVKQAVDIPIAIKLNPYFSSVGHMVLQLERAGANGLVLFNRLYEPDIDIFDVVSHPTAVLSQPEEVRLPLFWISLLHGRTGASLAASTGVESAVEVVKYLLAGADTVMTTSALLRHGPEHMRALREGVELWLNSHDMDSVERMRGTMSQRAINDPEAFVRANYIDVLQSSPNWV
jgi:dihydroorotate dehydrogenase (fumarate)